MILQILKISLIGGLINLDDVPLIQTMISQPVVAAPLLGWIFGDLKSGLVVGAFLQLLMGYLLPIGCAVPMDGSLVAIMAYRDLPSSWAILLRSARSTDQSGHYTCLAIFGSCPEGECRGEETEWKNFRLRPADGAG